MKAKKTLIWKFAFLKPLINLIESPVTLFGLVYTKIIEEVVASALMTQVAAKASGQNKINFQILQMI